MLGLLLRFGSADRGALVAEVPRGDMDRLPGLDVLVDQNRKIRIGQLGLMEANLLMNWLLRSKSLDDVHSPDRPGRIEAIFDSLTCGSS